MSKGVKVFLIISGVSLVLFGGAIGGVVWWFNANKEQLKAQGDAAKAEGAEYARGKEQNQCLAEGLRKLGACDGLICRVKAKLFFQACAEAALPSEGFCEGVPSNDEIINSATWRVGMCESHGMESDDCHNFMGGIQELCHP